MTTYEDEILHKFVKQFDGMPKLTAYDILHKVEALLHRHESPIVYKQIKEELKRQAETKNIYTIHENGYCYLADRCHYINVYKFKSIYPSFLSGQDLYFALSNGYKLNPLDDEHIFKAFRDTNLEYIIREFLKDNHVRKKNSKTNRLLLLELFDQIDPPNKVV